MKRQETSKLLEREENLPVLPQLFYRIVDAVSNPDTKVSELSNLILEDQVLTGRVLRMANAAYYAMPQKISTVTRAVMVLGFISLKNFITAVTVVDTLNNGAFKGGLFETFWVHALACGLLGSFLSKRLKVDHHEEAMIAGLVHDCGKLFLDHHFPDAYRSVADMIHEGKGVLVAEREVFGLTHAELGEEIGLKWHLAAPLVRAIRNHHRLSKSSKGPSLSDVIYLADSLSPEAIPKEWADRLQWMSLNGNRKGDVMKTCSDVGLSEETVEEVIEATWQNIEHIVEDLDISFLNPSREETVDQSPELFRLHREMERKDRQLAMVNEIGTFVTENPRPEELIQVVVEAIHRGIEFNRTLLFLVNSIENTLCGKLGLGYDVPPFLRTIKVPIESDGLMGRAVCEKTIFNIVDTQSPPYAHLPSLEVPSLTEINPFALVPFVAGTEVIGLIMVDNMVTREAIRDEEVNLMRTFLSMAGVYLAGYAKK